MSRADYDAAVATLAPFFAELGARAARRSRRRADPAFEDQAAALIEARPPVFSFIFGVPSPAILDRCRSLGIRTIGTATTVDEARALDAAGVDAIVATGFEAGGHRPSFLRSAEASLMGTLALVPQVADAVRAPILAAGGIADGRGVAAALALGAHAVQIGIGVPRLRRVERASRPIAPRCGRPRRARRPLLTRGFTGRLGRGIRNALAAAFESPAASRLPYPFQGHLVACAEAGRAGAGAARSGALLERAVGPAHHAHAGVGSVRQPRSRSASGVGKTSRIDTNQAKACTLSRWSDRSAIRQSSCPRFRDRLTEVVGAHACTRVPVGHTDRRKPNTDALAQAHTFGARAVALVALRDFSCSLPTPTHSRALVRRPGGARVLGHAVRPDADVERQH